jgi:branched-chain amino acid transport system ATP-binding protein
VLEVKNIDVSYDKLQVLWNVSMNVREGNLTVLIGLNGAGKTTLLKTISGILKPLHGSVFFDGKRIDNLPPHEIPKLGIAHVPEGRRLFPYMTVLENLEIGAYLPEPRRKKKDTLEEVFRLFPVLRERLNQKASSLSGGEQQMLTIARGLMLRPKLMFLDEPSLGLAPKMVRTVLDLLTRLHDKGIAILLVEQNVRLALKVADYGYVLETGKIVQEGEGSELATDERLGKTYMGY